MTQNSAEIRTRVSGIPSSLPSIPYHSPMCLIDQLQTHSIRRGVTLSKPNQYLVLLLGLQKRIESPHEIVGHGAQEASLPVDQDGLQAFAFLAKEQKVDFIILMVAKESLLSTSPGKVIG